MFIQYPMFRWTHDVEFRSACVCVNSNDFTIANPYLFSTNLRETITKDILLIIWPTCGGYFVDKSFLLYNLHTYGYKLYVGQIKEKIIQQYVEILYSKRCKSSYLLWRTVTAIMLYVRYNGAGLDLYRKATLLKDMLLLHQWCTYY